MKRFFALTAFFTVIAVMGATAKMFPIFYELDSLENGLKVIYSIDKSAPVVATVMHYHVGSKNEAPGQTGYAHFFEHLMFEATANIPRSTIDKMILEAGGNLNAYTSFDETVYHFQVPSERLNLALWIESQRMRKLLVDSAGVETQRGVVLEELKTRTDNQPYGSFSMKRQELTYPGTPYGWTVIGRADDIKKAKIEDFRAFYNTYYSPSNAVLSICGDFDKEEAKKLVRAYFGIYPKSVAPARPEFKPAPLVKEIRETVEDAKARIPVLYVTYRGPSMMDEDYYAVNLLLEILSTGESSRLNKRLVDKDQIATQAGVAPMFLESAGLMTLIARPAEGASIEKVEKALLEEIELIIKNGVSEEELTKAKNITEADLISGKKNALEKARVLARNMTYWGAPGRSTEELDKYLAVTKDQVSAMAKKYFAVEGKVTLIYLPKKS